MTEQSPIFQQSKSEEKATSSGNAGDQERFMEELDIQFANNFIAQGGKFVYCENMKQLFQMISSLKEENKWNFVFTWDISMKELMVKFGFQEQEEPCLIENSDAAISFCDSLVANSGVLMLAPDQATHRKLTTFPKHHIIISNKQSFVSNIDEAIYRFNQSYYNRLPSIIELNGDKPVHKANHARLLNAEGTRDLYVFYVDSDGFE